MRFLLKLFGEESAMGRFLNRLYIVIVTNLLFVLFSLPVVTIGACFSAMDYTLMKMQRGDRHFKVAQTFWKGFKECFTKATACFAALVLIWLFQALEISWCRQFRGAVALFQYALAGLMVLEAIVAMYLFPVIAAFNGSIGELLRDALFFAFSKPHRMLACLALHAVPIGITYWYLRYLPLWAFLWMMFGFAAIAHASTHIMLAQFVPFLPEVDICGGIIRPGQEGDPDIVVGEDDSGDDFDEKTIQEMMKYGL